MGLPNLKTSALRTQALQPTSLDVKRAEALTYITSVLDSDPAALEGVNAMKRLFTELLKGAPQFFLDGLDELSDRILKTVQELRRIELEKWSDDDIFELKRQFESGIPDKLMTTNNVVMAEGNARAEAIATEFVNEMMEKENANPISHHLFRNMVPVGEA